MRIELVLMARKDTKEIKRIYSHHAPFDHSRHWLDQHYPQAERIPVSSTSEGAILARPDRLGRHRGPASAQGDRSAHRQQKDRRGRCQPDHVCCRRGRVGEIAQPTHTSIVFELPHKPGSLVAVMNVLARRGLNLTKILSRPIPGRFSEYRFMIEFQAAASSAPAVAALQRIAKITDFLAVIGTYPVRKI